MYPDQILSEDNQFFQTTSPILIPLANKNNQNSYMNIISVSTDDEHSISSNSNSSRRQRLYSSFEVNKILYIQLSMNFILLFRLIQLHVTVNLHLMDILLKQN